MPNLCQRQKVEIIEIRGVFDCVEKSYLTQKVKNWSRTRLWVTLFVVFEARKTSMARLWLRAHHEMGPMGLGERFSFALERDDVRARLCDRLGGNDRFELVLRDGCRSSILHRDRFS